jgi:hypothetical protein
MADQPLLLRWKAREGYSYIGPFDSHDASVAWAEANISEAEWVTCSADPTVPLEVRAPGPQPPPRPPSPTPQPWLDYFRDLRELPDWLGDEPRENWIEPLGPDGAFYVLITFGEPPYLIGPFADHLSAYSWGVTNAERCEGTAGYSPDGFAYATDAASWQIVWLDAPGLVPPLRDPGA